MISSIRSIFFVNFILFSGIAIGAPVVQDLQGHLADGEVITISGSSFGSNGPQIAIFDDFSRGAGQHQQPISNGATIGAWTYSGLTCDGTSYPTWYWVDSVTGNVAAYVVRDDWETKLVLHDAYPLSTEIYVSYKFRILDSGNGAAGVARIAPSNSNPWSWDPANDSWGWHNWKMSYICGTVTLAVDDDVMSPFTSGTAGSGTTTYSLNSNDTQTNSPIGPYTTLQNPKPAWSMEYWNRVGIWLKGDQTYGEYWFQSLGWDATTPGANRNVKIQSGNATKPMFDGNDEGGNDDDDIGWTSATFSGDVVPKTHAPERSTCYGGGTYLTNCVYDDIYLAYGTGARARVEIGNDAVYANCTKMDISTPTSWSNESIDVTVRLSQFAINEDAYLFVVDQNGIAGPGYAVTVGRSTRVLPKTTLNLEPDIRVAETYCVSGRRVSKLRKTNCAHLILLRRHGRSTKRAIVFQP